MEASGRPAYLNVTSPSCPYGFSLNDWIVREKRERLIPIGGIETQSIAQRPLSSTSPHCECKVEFRPDRRPGNEYQPNEVICK